MCLAVPLGQIINFRLSVGIVELELQTSLNVKSLGIPFAVADQVLDFFAKVKYIMHNGCF